MSYYREASPLADNDWFSHLALAEAGEVAERDPATLTDRQLGMIATYDQGAAQRYAHRRAEAREKAQAHATAWSEQSARPAVAPRTTGADAAPTRREQMLLRAIATATREKDQRIEKATREREQRLERKAHQVDEFAMRIEVLEAQIKALRKELDDRPIGAIDAGVWAPGKSYRAGAGVTADGHYWIAQTTTATAPGDGNPEWRLAVHRGKTGRDGRDLRAS